MNEGQCANRSGWGPICQRTPNHEGQHGYAGIFWGGMNEDEMRTRILDEVLAMLTKNHDPYDHYYSPGYLSAIEDVESMKEQGGAE